MHATQGFPTAETEEIHRVATSLTVHVYIKLMLFILLYLSSSTLVMD